MTNPLAADAMHNIFFVTPMLVGLTLQFPVSDFHFWRVCIVHHKLWFIRIYCFSYPLVMSSSCRCISEEIGEGEMTIVLSSKNVNIGVSYDESTYIISIIVHLQYWSHYGLLWCLCLIIEYKKSACPFYKICTITFQTAYSASD